MDDFDRPYTPPFQLNCSLDNDFIIDSAIITNQHAENNLAENISTAWNKFSHGNKHRIDDGRIMHPIKLRKFIGEGV